MSALEPVILNEVKLTQKAVADLASSSSGAVIGAVGQIVKLPNDTTMLSDGSAVYLRSGILTSDEEYPDYPYWLPRYGGITWTQRTLPASTDWLSVTSGNGLFVAVASGSAIAATSPDGITWIQRTLPAATDWRSVTYGNGVFVAVAYGGTAATSPDGITWTQRALPVSTYWQSVTYGNGVFVAVTYSGSIAATSPDGITWTQRTLPASTGWYSITYGNGVFVAVAYNSATAATSPVNLIGTDVYTKNEYVRVK